MADLSTASRRLYGSLQARRFRYDFFTETHELLHRNAILLRFLHNQLGRVMTNLLDPLLLCIAAADLAANANIIAFEMRP
jgi:hypothetical protein